MRAVDTNVLVRLLARDAPEQVAAAEAFVGPGAWVSLIVLVEATWALKAVYGVPPARIADAVEMLLEHDRLAVQEPATVARAVAHLRKRPKIGFSDCLVLEVARAAGHLPLGTFDRDLARLPDTERLGGGSS